MEKKWFILTSVALSLSSVALASGGHSGNGGGAFICSIDSTKSVFLDLYEAQEVVKDGGLGLSVRKSDDSVDRQIKDAFEKLNPKTTLFSEVMAIYSEVRKARHETVPSNRQLAWPSDEQNKYAPNECYRGDDETVKYPYLQKGIILYHDAGSDSSHGDTGDWMDIDESTLADLLPQQQAAAWVHETIYKFRRKRYGDGDSVIARKIVGTLFSDLTGDALDTALLQYGLSPKTGASHLEKEGSTAGFSPAKFYQSYSNEIGPEIQYRIYLKEDPSRDKHCKSPEQLDVPMRGYLPNWGSLTSRMGNDPSVKCLSGSNSCVTYGMPQGEGTVFEIKNLDRLFFQPSSFINSKIAYCPFTVEITDSNSNKVEMNLSYQDLYGIAPANSRDLDEMQQMDPLDLRAKNPGLDMSRIPFSRIDLTRQFYAIQLYKAGLTP